MSGPWIPLLNHVIFLSNGAVAGAMMGCKFGFKKLPEDLLQFPHRKWLDRKVHQFLVTIGLTDQQQSKVDQGESQTEKERDQENQKEDTLDQTETVNKNTKGDNQAEAMNQGRDVGDKNQDQKDIAITKDENKGAQGESKDAKDDNQVEGMNQGTDVEDKNEDQKDIAITKDDNQGTQDASQDAKDNQEKVADRDASKDDKKENQDAMDGQDTRSLDQNQDQPPGDQEVTTESMDHSTTTASSSTE